MIQELSLENFKCFEERVTIPFGKLTLLAGTNSKGKSSAVQPLLALHQSMVASNILERVDFNGKYTHLGAFSEVRNHKRPSSDPIVFEVVTGDLDEERTCTKITLRQEDATERWGRIVEVAISKYRQTELLEPIRSRTADGLSSLRIDFRDTTHADPFDEFDSFADASRLEELSRLHYISADRLGPQEYFERQQVQGFDSVGIKGEYAAEMLYRSEQRQITVYPEVVRSTDIPITVVDQVGAWLSYIFDGGAVRVGAPLTPILTLDLNSDGGTRYVRPVNLGFGVSYVLPIVVAALTVAKGDLLIVENPEAHLHPKAQSRIGELLAMVSAAGIQVIVESHSEHILNSFRIAVKNGAIEAQDVSILFFSGGVDPLIRIELDPGGAIETWPNDFFDQKTRDFVRMFGK